MSAGNCESILYDFLSEENLAALQAYLQSSRPPENQGERSSSSQMYFTEDTTRYHNFRAMVEERVEEICHKHTTSSDAFNDYILQNSSDPMIETFATVLQLSTSFEVFMEMLLNEEKRKYLFTTLRNYRNMFQPEMTRGRN